MAIDITKDSKQADTLDLVLESLPVAVIAFKDGVLLNANENYHQYIGPKMSEILKPGLTTRGFVEYLYQTHDGIDTDDPELDTLHKTDKPEWIRRRLALYSADSKFDQYDSDLGWWRCISKYYPESDLYIGIRIDISELKSAQEKAVTASRAKSEFLANMSHEIRTPMNGIMGMAELLNNSNVTGKEREFIDIIQRSGQSLLTIINDILDFSKIESGQIELDPAPFILRDAIEDIMALMSTATRETGVDLIVKIDPDLPASYMGDVGRIRQVLMNIIGNAVKFTHEGHVLIDVSTQDNASEMTSQSQSINLQINVIDTGVGIPAHKTEHIFEQFNQADSSTTREYGGTGLGLSIARNLTKIMSGDLTVSSEVGVGSTFSLSLPLPACETEQPAASTPQLPIKGNILIIDDTPVNHDVLKGQLESEACKIISVESAAKGLTVLKKAHENNVPLDLILLDYHMPQYTGEDFIIAMRKHSHYDHIPVIMLSSVDTDILKKRILKAGAQEYMTKPARLANLKRVISDTLNRAPQGISEDIFGEMLQDDPKNISSQNLIDRIIEPHQSSQPQSNVLETPQGSHINILIAEDNEVNQMYIRYIMEDLGVSFKIVENGQAAVDKWQVLKPEIILMDVSMPQLNGYEATQKIRAIEAEQGRMPTPIISVTAHAMKSDRENSSKAGMNDHLSKPVSRAVLIEKIRQWAPNIGIEAERDLQTAKAS